MSASERRARPVIGLTTYVETVQQGVWDGPAAYLQYQYVESVTRAGGVAVLLPPQQAGAGSVDAILDRLDGLVLTGGKDVDARLYGATPHAEADRPRPRETPGRRSSPGQRSTGPAAARHLPRRTGAQRRPRRHARAAPAGPHRRRHAPRRTGRFAHHDVRIVPGTRLAVLFGESAGAACYHHQALADLAPGLVATGHAEDGVVEAVELPAARFVLAVQWHPEQIRDDVRLFRALVEAASTVPAVAGAVGRVPR